MDISETSTLVPAKRCKVAVVGDPGCGKTSIIFRFSRGRLPSPAECGNSTALDTEEVKILRNRKTYHLVIYDTGGHDDDARLRALSYRDCDVVVLCFALDRPDSLVNIHQNWSKEISHLTDNVPVILVGTKADLRGQQCVSKREGKRTAKMIRAVKYFECSSFEEPCDKRIMRVFGRVLREAKGDMCCCCPCL